MNATILTPEKAYVSRRRSSGPTISWRQKETRMGEKRGLKALELWCRRITDGYHDVAVRDMSSSWRDGLAFCALIHHFRPDLIDFDTLRKGDILRNNRLAFTVAETQLGIPALLDAEDMLAYQEPDRLSVATYVSQFYQYFEGSLGARRKAAANPMKRTAAASSPAPLNIGPPTKVFGVGDSCHVCKQRVFLLERLMVDSRLYHRTCFRCARCRALLNPGAYNECDNAPSTYECTVCPRDETTTASPKATRQVTKPPSPISLPKPQIPEKKLELAESFRAARKLFENSMVDGSPQESPKPLRKSESASSLSSKLPLSSTPRMEHVASRTQTIVSPAVEKVLNNLEASHTLDTGQTQDPSSAAQTTLRSIPATSLDNSPGSKSAKRLSLTDNETSPLEETCFHKTENSDGDASLPKSSSLASELSKIVESASASKSEDVAKWNSIKEPELPAFLRQRDGPRKSTVQENIKRFSLDTPSARKDSPPSTFRGSAGTLSVSTPTKDPQPKSQVLKECDKTDSVSESKGNHVTDGKEDYSTEIIPPSRKLSLDLPVIRPAETPVSILPKPAPRTRPSKASPSVETSTVDVKDIQNSFSASDSMIIPGTPEEEEDEEGVPPPFPASLPPEAVLDFKDDAPVPAARSFAGEVSNIETEGKPVSADESRENEQQSKHAYPTSLNPFGDSDENEESEKESYPESLNPFGSDDESEVVAATPLPKITDYDNSLNPFSEDDDEAVSPVRMGSSRKKAPPPPRPLHSSGTSTPVSLRSVDSSPALQRSPMGHRPSPKPRKKPAPLPPSLTTTPDPKSESSPTPAADLSMGVESLKSEKNERNASIQMQAELSESEREPSPQKNTFGYWKRKKRPAPSVPVPVRREIKRIPMKEIHQEMEEIVEKQEELEQQGREIEMQIRDKNALEPSLEEEELIMQLFELVNEKNNLFRRQAELMYIKRSQRLEEEQVELEYQIRCIMTKPGSQKTEEDTIKEEELLQRLLEVVEQRNEIVESQEMDRRRVAQEDWSIQEQMAQKQSEMKEKMSPASTTGKKKEKKKKHKKGDKKEDGKESEEEKRKSLRKIIKQKLVPTK
ncbi:MICAL-like protein 1 isoform X2 [Ornithodoros turicata]|uniref:MICAL-like protein 1 isoform X2 n=1 Tax=Ornithodoros turicata TaxID=34597 RepID=UPI00313A4847